MGGTEIGKGGPILAAKISPGGPVWRRTDFSLQLHARTSTSTTPTFITEALRLKLVTLLFIIIIIIKDWVSPKGISLYKGASQQIQHTEAQKQILIKLQLQTSKLESKPGHEKASVMQH